MMSVRLCFILVILIVLLEIVPVIGFSNHFRKHLHYSKIESTTQSESHLPDIDTYTPNDIDDNDNFDSDNNGVVKTKKLIRNDFTKVSRYKIKYYLIKKTLLKYKELYGDMLVPKRFIIPINSTDFSEEVWDIKLGRLVDNIRCHHAYSEMENELKALGFDYGSQSIYTFDLIKTALLKYKELKGDMLVPTVFVVPDNCTDFLEEVWGMKLGIVVLNIRNQNTYPEKKDELIGLGFDYGSQLKYSYYNIKTALLKYKELNGDMLVPRLFIVPINSTDFPHEVWEMKLGHVVKNIRRGAYSENRKELVALGFIFVLRKFFNYESVKVAIYKYRELRHGSVKFPVVYTIPYNDSWYPKETWGLPLGSYVLRIKQGSLWPDKGHELFS